jgi:RNA polymerase sigma-70 factor (ECF subfamily)
MPVKRSCTLPENGSRTDWVRREAEVGDLAGLSGVLGKLNEPNPPRTRVVRWQELPTADLVALAQAGQMDAFDPLFRRFGGRLVRFVTGRVFGDRMVAEDIASEVWIRVMTYIGRWEDRGGNAEHAFFGWLCFLARQGVARRHADDGVWREIPASLGDDHTSALGMADAPDTAGDDAPDSAEHQELLARLAAGVDGLNPTYRQVVRMRLEGLTNEEIAPRVGLSLIQVHKIWPRALVALRRQLSEPIDEVETAQLREVALLLPTVQRQVALLRLDGLANHEVAARVELSLEQARFIWARAKDGMRRLLATPPAAAPVAPDTQEQARLREAARLLPAAQARVALMRLDGHCNKDIAQSLGCTSATASIHWRKAQTAFARQGLTVVA